MSHSRNLNNGKWQSFNDLENAVNELEENLTDIVRQSFFLNALTFFKSFKFFNVSHFCFKDKIFIRKVLSGLTGLMNSITHGKTGNFKVVLKWFGLYLVSLM